MTLGITEDHLELHRTVRRWVDAQGGTAPARAALEAAEENLPAFWKDLAELGWLGLHLSEAYGGEGFGLAETAVVAEELGRVCAPGPFLPTVLASAVIDAMGTAAQRERWLPGLADGSVVGAVGLPGSPLVVGGGLADRFVLARRDAPDRWSWWVLDRDQVTVVCRRSVDATRRVAAVELRPGVEPEPDRRLDGPDVVEQLMVALWAAEAVGGMAWCVSTAADYAKVRVQFGRPIGQFQAVKHRCADLLLSLELARAAAWDVAGCDPQERELAASVARAVVPPAAFEASKDCIQVLGGIGYTWEHDAHLFLKRATTLRQLLPPEPGRVARLALAGARRTLSVQLPSEAEAVRAEVRAFLEQLRVRPREEWNRLVADAGYLVPHWPAPWGRDAAPVEQLVIDQEFAAAGVRRPHLQVGAWVLPTLIAHGTPEQQERFIGPTLRGEITWCQMFSEPGAGSDLASLSTRAERVEGGWSLTGQKVWTTMAHLADWGICLARTGDPEARPGGATERHRGITCFLVDMGSPGLEVRPLRELTGHELFNEVFLDGVLVPDDCVVGGVGHGWEAARTTLANERVSMGSGSSFGPGVESVLELVREAGGVPDGVLDEVGDLVARAQALAVLGLRSTLQALSGAEPGAGSSVRKLLGVEHEQRVQEVGLALLGADALIQEGEAGVWIAGFLGNRALSIAGGTSDVQRNIIAERLLGLPKDP